MKNKKLLLLQNNSNNLNKSILNKNNEAIPIKFNENIKILKDISEEDIEKYKQFYLDNDYVVIKNILTTEIIETFNNYIKFTSKLDNIQFNRKHNIDWEGNNNYLINFFQKKTLDFYKSITNNNIYSTFSFAMEYNTDCEVLPHLDLIQNEISSTICYNSEGDYPLYLSNEFIENNYNNRYSLKNSDSIHSEKICKLDINVGDIGIFNGRNHLHWRNKLDKNLNYRALLSHYSITKPDSEEWKAKTKDDVPFKNSIQNIY